MNDMTNVRSEVRDLKFGVVDLFCGVGGLTCGLEKAGLDVVAGYDLDATCEYPYTYNNHSLFINKNIEEVTGKEIRKFSHRIHAVVF